MYVAGGCVVGCRYLGCVYLVGIRWVFVCGFGGEVVMDIGLSFGFTGFRSDVRGVWQDFF